ncbi:polysaccharide biosynthesis tyrosine autokinase [Sphingomonas sp. PB2P19]|uniref:GumC family protein n=1 Tax=Sphingomonas rhamnosi TaxID=3096156 RepID=UPI002FCAEE97
MNVEAGFTKALSGVPDADVAVVKTPLLAQIGRIAWRRRWLIASGTAAAVILGLIITLLMTPLYTATSQIEISREGNRVTEIQGVEREATTSDLEFYQTQYGLLQSESLAQQIARDLKLADNPQFFKMFNVNPDKRFSAVNGAGKPATREQRVRAAATVLLDNATIAPIRGSRLVDISFTSPDPALSLGVANAWGKNFISTNLARRYDATSYARNFLESRLAGLRERLERSERELVAYAQRSGIINLPGNIDRQTGATTGERSLTADTLEKLNASLSEAIAERIAAESQVQNGSGASNAETIRNTAINQLRERRAELSADYAKLMTQFEPEYPAARALQSQIAALDRNIQREEARVSSSFSTAYNASRERERNLGENVDQLKKSLTGLRTRSIQYNILQREVDTNRQLYDGLLQRYKEIGVAGGVGNNNISIVDQAELPTKPSKPRLALNLFLALIAGLLLSSGAAWLLEHVSEGINDPSDLPQKLGIPLLGTVPISDGDALADLDNPKSELIDAYLAIQTNLALATPEGFPRSLSMTSTRPKEGKSTSAYALAHALARRERRVVLVDGDMRAPMVHKEFHLSNDTGLSNFLSGNEDITKSLHSATQANLTIMTAGPTPPNAADLLAGPRLRMLVDRLLESYDHVIIDSPPVMGLADAPLIARAVTGTIYAVESHNLRTSLAVVALGRLRSAKVNVLGAVMTKFNAKQSSYGYGYDYGYGYGHQTSAK